ncbi:multidrug effflux MFS transporter [Maricaulis sp.]|uniref:multidrug effflux MFS transporter n=1 Tax=Maricaulis sp. TaxID=1486257 RepID=UPI002613E4F3|nr:multidrug effflux MFS transporter [Maricaulis sp.]
MTPSSPTPIATRSGDNSDLPLPLWELVALMVAITGLVALSIDMMLPALDDIAADLDVARANSQQNVISAYLLGFAVAQIIYGPLSDRFGRKPVMMGAIGVYLIVTLICAMTPSFTLLLTARFAQGAAAAASRVITVAIARDLTSGRRMAEIMSLVMTAFMAVPVLAPAMGQLIMVVADWRWIFGALFLFGIALLAWIHIRLPETLHPEYRVPLKVSTTVATFAEALRNRQLLGYTLAAMAFFGGLYAFLNSSQQVFISTYGLGDNQFPLAFAIIATGMGAMSFINSRLVQRLGQRRLAHTALIVFTAVSLVHTASLLAGVHSAAAFLGLLAIALAALGLIAANFSSIAMEPMGHIAGTASAAYGMISGVGGTFVGWAIGQLYDGTAIPLIAGQALMGAAAIAIVLVTERGRLFGTGDETHH